MKHPHIDDPLYWRERAEEARRIAEQLAEAVAKQTMLDIARSYDNLAKLLKRVQHLSLQIDPSAVGREPRPGS